MTLDSNELEDEIEEEPDTVPIPRPTLEELRAAIADAAPKATPAMGIAVPKRKRKWWIGVLALVAGIVAWWSFSHRNEETPAVSSKHIAKAPVASTSAPPRSSASVPETIVTPVAPVPLPTTKKRNTKQTEDPMTL